MLINKDPYLKQQFCYVPSNKTTFALKWYLLGQSMIANSKTIHVFQITCLPFFSFNFCHENNRMTRQVQNTIMNDKMNTLSFIKNNQGRGRPGYKDKGQSL